MAISWKNANRNADMPDSNETKKQRIITNIVMVVAIFAAAAIVVLFIFISKYQKDFDNYRSQHANDYAVSLQVDVKIAPDFASDSDFVAKNKPATDWSYTNENLEGYYGITLAEWIKDQGTIFTYTDFPGMGMFIETIMGCNKGWWMYTTTTNNSGNGSVNGDMNNGITDPLPDVGVSQMYLHKGLNQFTFWAIKAGA